MYLKKDYQKQDQLILFKFPPNIYRFHSYKKFLLLFLLTFTGKAKPINILHKMRFFDSSLYININSHKTDQNIKILQPWARNFHDHRDN